MNRIEKAYSLGYRATIDGKLYLNDKELPLYIRKKNLGRNLLYFWVPGINTTVHRVTKYQMNVISINVI